MKGRGMFSSHESKIYNNANRTDAHLIVLTRQLMWSKH